MSFRKIWVKIRPQKGVDLKLLSPLAHFTTLCNRNFLASYELLHTLHDVSNSLHKF